MHKALKCADDVKQRPFTPQAHQVRVTKEFLETNKRGLLFWHQLGSGKTCACYMAVDQYRDKKAKGKKVYILGPAALASTHRDQYCELCGAHPKEYFRDFHYYSYNDRAGIAKKMAAVNMDDSIIIIDEVQDVINGKGNNSPSLTAVYDKVLRAARAKVILLSATPFYDEFGSALMINLLEPGSVPMVEGEYLSLIKNKEYLYEKLRGLISYVPVPNPELYPTRVEPDIVDVIPMSKEQFAQYSTVRDEELEKNRIRDEQIAAALRRGNRKQADKLKALQFIQMSKLKSRQLCNFSYPSSVFPSDDGDEDEDVEEKEHAGVVNIKNDLNARWILDDPEDTHVANMKEYGPKMAKLIWRLLTLPGKHMVYGWFKSRYGLNLIYTYLKHCGVESLIFSGDLTTDDKRAAVINKFNADDNIRGEKYKVVLVSGAGAMGISLFGIRHLHVFEASMNEFITVQAEGRAFRTMSHHQLPPEERNVQVYRYFTSLPADARYVEPTSTEQQVHQRGMEKMKAVQAILEVMKRASFDCRESYNHAIKDCHDYDAPPTEEADDYDFQEDPYEEVIEV